MLPEISLYWLLKAWSLPFMFAHQALYGFFLGAFELLITSAQTLVQARHTQGVKMMIVS